MAVLRTHPLPPRLSRARLPVRLLDLLRVVRPQGLRPAAEPDGADPHGPLRPAPAHRRLRQAPGQGGRRPRGRGQAAVLGPAGLRPGRRLDRRPAPARLELRPGGPGWTSFPGDIIVILYLLSLPTLILFLAGWSSTNLFSTIGGVARPDHALRLRGAPASWPSSARPSWPAPGGWPRSPPSTRPGRCSCWSTSSASSSPSIAVQAKLERTPFDIPHAETEIVGGTFTEYSGKKLALFRLTFDIEMVVASRPARGRVPGRLPRRGCSSASPTSSSRRCSSSSC
ncbi:MAG: NADH-quinone oxidoreductase subunit H [Desulfomicrobium escambiense]|nr:NADH-quinone oxidoreductase subunit H [Desulfomicrobium escambiense]